MVGAMVFQRPRRLAPENVCFDTRVHDPAVDAEWGGEGRAHVSHRVEFFPDGARAQLVLVVIEEDGPAIRVLCEGVVGGLGSEHAAAHGGVGTFDFGDVEEAGGVPDESTPRESTFGNGLVAAFVESAGAVGDAFSALDDGSVKGVVFELLEFAVGG